MRALLAWIGVTAIATAAGASERVIAEVTQPIGGTGEGIVLAGVSYVGWFNVDLDPWPAIRLTTAPNSIVTDRGAADLNLASNFGIKASLSGPPSQDPYRPQGLRGDTLDVRLSIPVERTTSASSPVWVQSVVGATLECVLVNARRYWPRVRFVQVRVEGDAGFSNLSQVYALETVPPSSTPRLPQDPKESRH